MDAQKVDMYIMTHSKFFEPHLLPAIREKLLQTDDSRLMMMESVTYREPILMLIISILGGHFGIDRFIIGDTGLGVGKLLTCGGLGVWTIVDWFLIMGRTREVNFEKLRLIVG
jgi:TM2 domain-containing membrane protein YozV